MYKNLKKIFTSRFNLLSYILLVIISAGIWYYFTNIAIIIGNYGEIHGYLDIFLSILIIFLFPLFIVGTLYKSWNLGKIGKIKGTTSGFIGGFIGTIISGASCCGATLATSFGLLPLMTFLPYDGLEIKIIATIGLIYGLYSTIQTLDTCSLKK